jgi:hypothetical protein
LVGLLHVAGKFGTAVSHHVQLACQVAGWLSTSR